MDTEAKIFFFMSDHRNATSEFTSQEKLAKAISTYYNLAKPMTQGTVSKAFNDSELQFTIASETYRLVVIDKTYRLFNTANDHMMFTALKQEFIDSDLVEYDKLCKITESVYALKISEGTYDLDEAFAQISAYLIKLFPNEVLFDIRRHGNLAIIMLQLNASDRKRSISRLENLFSTK